MKKMDDEFQRLQVEVLQCYNQGPRLKEPLRANEKEVEKGLLHIEIKQLQHWLTQLNEDYKGQIEISFELEDQLSTLENTVTTLNESKHTLQKDHDRLTNIIKNQKQHLEASNQGLEVAHQQIAALQIQQQEQGKALTAAREEKPPPASTSSCS